MPIILLRRRGVVVVGAVILSRENHHHHHHHFIVKETSVVNKNIGTFGIKRVLCVCSGFDLIVFVVGSTACGTRAPWSGLSAAEKGLLPASTFNLFVE
jgi:hypothetical protein